MPETEEDSNIKLNIKSTVNSFDISIAATASVSEVKDIILTKIENATKAQLCLIFSGKILKDPETLVQHNITDGMAIHLVVRQNNSTLRPTPNVTPAAQPAQANTNNSTPAPPPSPNAGGLPPADQNAAGASPLFRPTPDRLRRMMESPLVQRLLNSPDIMRSMFANNPQIQSIIERNPEVGHILNDPDVLRQTMELLRNPNMYQEMLRSHDLAIRNLQGIPGGEAALQRLYHDVQEPLLNGTVAGFAGNPFASRSGEEDTSSRSQRAGVENSEALPNPWGPPSSGGGGGGGGIPDLGASLADLGPVEGLDGAAFEGIENLLSGQNIEQMLSQVMPNIVQQMMQRDPNNAELADHVNQHMPQVINFMTRPEHLLAMANPQVNEAVRQIYQGIDVLRREAPDIARLILSGGVLASAPESSSPQSNTSTGSTTASAGSVNGLSPEFMNMMSNMIGGMNLGGSPLGGAPQESNQNPEELYASQLEQLSNMGFGNRAQNIAALRATFGDINAAIERLLNSPQ